MAWTQVFAVFVVALVVGTVSAEDGPALTKCSRNDPHVNECLVKSIQGAIRMLKDGFAPLSMPALDPLVIPNLEMFCPRGDRANLTNYKVMGIKDVVVEKASYVPHGADMFELSFSLLLPHFECAGTYTMEKGYLGAEKSSSGTFTFGLTDYRVDFVLDGAVKDGFATLTGKSSSFNGGNNPKVHFSDTGDKLNGFLNSQPKWILKSYKTAIDKLHPVMAAMYSNMLFQKVPFDMLFPASA